MPVVLDMEYAIDEKARTKLADMNNELRTDIAICFMERIKKAGYLPMFYSFHSPILESKRDVLLSNH